MSAEVKLQHQGDAAHIVMNGTPMLILGGELSNSAATSIADIDSVMPRMARMGLNTVLVPAQWDLMEADEGKFDFSLIDETINRARENHLKVIFLWFGAWKNSMSCYAPLWFKQDVKKYPRAMTRTGKPLEIASAFSENVFEADERAFSRLMAHIAEVDSRENTVILYVNAAMNSRGRKPGQYPSAGPLAHLAEIWRCAAPDIDILAPDIYDTGFKGWASQYAMKDNPLFIPESRCCINSGVRAFYTFGEHEAVGFSAFAIDQAPVTETQYLTKSYALLNQLTPLLLKYQGKDVTHGLLFDQQDKERIIADGDLMMTCRHYFTLPWDARATDGSTWPEGGAVIIKLAADDFLIAGSGVVVTFQTATEKKQEEKKTLGEDGFVNAGDGQNSQSTASRFVGKRIGIGYVDEVDVDAAGNLRYIRRENGDQDHQGRHARISVGDYKILHIKLYQY
jgi:hypothetical protein